MLRRGFYFIATILYFGCINSLVESVTAGTCSSETCEGEEEDPTREEEDWGWWEDDVSGLEAIWANLNCEEIFNRGPRPVHNTSTWMLLRGAYRGTLGPGESSISTRYDNGFNVGFEVKNAPKKGRGVYATEPIKNGTLVWDTINVACFYTGDTYRWYLGSIPEDLACDVFIWAYVSESDICVDLDEGSLINSAGGSASFEKNGVKPNVGIGGETGGQYALRDIEPGEEILTNYDAFDTTRHQGWNKFGLGKWKYE